MTAGVRHVNRHEDAITTPHEAVNVGHILNGLYGKHVSSYNRAGVVNSFWDRVVRAREINGICEDAFAAPQEAVTFIGKAWNDVACIVRIYVISNHEPYVRDRKRSEHRTQLLPLEPPGECEDLSSIQAA